jgi:hypothetical protein
MGRACSGGLARLERIESDEKRPEESAKDAVDPKRLLEGEDPSTPHPQDARHWVEVYSQLLTFKEQTLAGTERNLEKMPAPEARDEAETDVTVLEAERERLRQRLDFWEKRHRELTAE